MTTIEPHCPAIAIVGGGFSGALTAAQLIRHGFTGELTIIEPREQLGAGLAYSTTFEQHLLNVPAGKMSALPSEPRHFLNWLRSGPMPEAAPDTFAPRRLYGAYVENLLKDVVRTAPRFRHVRAEAIMLEADAHAGACLLLNNRSHIAADYVVLALGNPASCVTPWMTECTDRWSLSPWLGESLKVRFGGERILLVGTGLTAVDCALALHSQEVPCTTYMLSRRGILPHVHNLKLPPSEPPVLQDPGNLRHMLRELRGYADAARDADLCWRVVVDSLRPVTNQLWQGLSSAEQTRFLRHLKTFWETHRHRMAPQIRARLNELIAAGLLEVVAGRIRETECAVDCIEARLQLRQGGERTLKIDRVITCTGIHENYRKSPRPLIRSLISSGVAQPSEHGLGFRTDRDGALLDSSGRPSPVLFTLGPPRRGDLFETTAVPDIRVQAESLGRLLAARRSQ